MERIDDDFRCPLIFKQMPCSSQQDNAVFVGSRFCGPHLSAPTLECALDVSASLIRFLEAMSRADDPVRCTQGFAHAVEAFGIEVFAAGEIDPRARHRNVFFAVQWPERWRRFYFDNQMINRDPLVNALAQRRNPFTWSELLGDPLFPAQDRLTFALCAEHGWTEGLAVPIPRGPSRIGLVSLVGCRPAFSTDEKACLTMMSVYFHERIRPLVPAHGFPTPPAGLSTRELQCLGLVSRGRTDGQIAATMGIARTTAHEHVENGKSKLGAATRAGAIALAVAYGILAP